MHRIFSFALICVSALFLSGCTHVQLRRNTVRQALTVGDIQTQQVLNNLAMFVVNPNALPFFSYPNQSGSNVTDSGTATLTPALGRSASPFNFFGFTTITQAFSGERQMAESFTLNPVNDPRKLELMRCAYQKAVANCQVGRALEACPDCQNIQKKFYTGDPDGDIPSAAEGIVTSDCLGPKPCWFHWGPKKCLPKNCECLPIGHFCGTFVWVVDDVGRDELTKLTIAILDYAQNSAPVPLTKTVSYYIDEYGLPTAQSNAVGQVSAAVQITEQPASLMNMAAPDEVRIEQIIKGRLVQVNLELAELEQVLAAKKATSGDGAAPKADGGGAPKSDSTKPGSSTAAGSSDPDSAKFTALLAEQQTLESKLRYLGEQLRIEGLKHPYVPVGPAPSVPSSILPFQLQQQTLGVTPLLGP